MRPISTIKKFAKEPEGFLLIFLVSPIFILLIATSIFAIHISDELDQYCQEKYNMFGNFALKESYCYKIENNEYIKIPIERNEGKFYPIKRFD